MWQKIVKKAYPGEKKVGKFQVYKQLHRKKRFSFPSPAGMSLAKLPLGRNNSVIVYLSRRVKYGRIVITERVVFDHRPLGSYECEFTRHPASQFVYAGSQPHSLVCSRRITKEEGAGRAAGEAAGPVLLSIFPPFPGNQV